MPTTYAIPNGRTVFNATTYAGTSATQSVVNADNGTVGFKPDFIWIKNRTGANDNILFDSNRGSTSGYYYELISNGTVAENYYTAGNYGMVSAINSNGFTVASSNSNWNLSNASGNNYVAWQWQAGQGTTSSNTNGSITSTVSVNASAGFSVVTYTGTGVAATVGHGIGVAPKMILLKQRNGSTYAWNSYHASLGNTYYIQLNTSAAADNSVSLWNNTSPTSSVFSLSNSVMNNSGGTYVAYCWADVAGFSQFGSYTGNGSTDGPFIYTGFRPKFVLLKSSTQATDWYIYDTARDAYNVSTLELNPNLAAAEQNGTYGSMDILSNGFKLRFAGGEVNVSGQTYIYACFAENPFKYANAR